MTELTDQETFVRRREAARRFGVTPRTLERWEQRGVFPKRLQIGPGTVGYRASELEEFAKSRQCAQRRQIEPTNSAGPHEIPSLS
jgi:predicted DNA-binding transcriptional regulator AlpA